MKAILRTVCGCSRVFAVQPDKTGHPPEHIRIPYSVPCQDWRNGRTGFNFLIAATYQYRCFEFDGWEDGVARYLESPEIQSQGSCKRCEELTVDGGL
jgi:hypothetical protein